MRKWLAGLLSRLADILYPSYPVRQRRGIDVTTVPPGYLVEMTLSGTGPSPELRAAIVRAAHRRESQGWNN